MRGVETWAHDLAAELHGRSVDVTLFKGGGPASAPYEVRLACTNHKAPIWNSVCQVTRHGGWRLGLATPEKIQHTTFALSLIHQLRRGQFDMVHLQDAWAGYVLERAHQRGLHRAKVILGHGTNEPLDFLLKFQHVQELSPYHLNRDREHGLPADRKWFALPNFVDGNLFSPGETIAARSDLNLPRDRFIVLDIAVLKPHHKRIEWLVEEVATLRRTRPEVFLVVAGASAPETPFIQQLIHDKLGDNARVLMDVKRSQMPTVYRAADLIAHPIFEERMPVALLEALATGIPVIAHRFPIHDWVIGPGGCTVDMAAPGELANQIESYIKDPAHRNKAGRAAREHVMAHFEKSRVVDDILGMYEAVLRDAGGELRVEGREPEGHRRVSI